MPINLEQNCLATIDNLWFLENQILSYRNYLFFEGIYFRYLYFTNCHKIPNNPILRGKFYLILEIIEFIGVDYY